MNILGSDIEQLLGTDGIAIDDVDRAAQAALGRPVIIWEGDPATFQFSYVSPIAADLLGWPVARWTREPAFWSEIVIAPEDRDDAVAYCALATGRRADHVFEYRARCADGRVLWLRDFVHVVIGAKGVPRVLRGAMIDVTAEKAALRELRAATPRPSMESLLATT